MKRFHVHVAVQDLPASIRFYSSVFGAEPSVLKPDYAKWMLEDPRINFAISQRCAAVGVNHLGIQVDSAQELAILREQVAAADIQARQHPHDLKAHPAPRVVEREQPRSALAPAVR